ncbi:MAG: hemerythrin domain-containing protein [Boseongicola sp.]|nr:MAG: hemerythrin domain-containing protein [Boseongicola sp.]
MNEGLNVRDGLPDALRVLLNDYPRELWEIHPNFSQLILFWLDRHQMFRRLIGKLSEETENALSQNVDPRVFNARLSKYAGFFVRELHGHHTIEDQHYFPLLKQLETGLESGFDILDRDHHSIDAQLDTFIVKANQVIQFEGSATNWRDEVGPFSSQLKLASHNLNRHLVDEEELVVPILLKHQPESLA